jgi:alkylation response protein AidB-like acyl-CoA dehydrogenase
MASETLLEQFTSRIDSSAYSGFDRLIKGAFFCDRNHVQCFITAVVGVKNNTCFQEDFDELVKAGYMTATVPTELGGGGLSLSEYSHEVRRLAYYAPATALGLNMHLYWVGLAADLWRFGDKSLEWILTETMNGAIFAVGHADSGNDLPVLLSTTKAEKVNGGYRFTGKKSFGSLTPV